MSSFSPFSAVPMLYFFYHFRGAMPLLGIKLHLTTCKVTYLNLQVFLALSFEEVLRLGI